MKEKMICCGDLFYYDFGDNSGSVQSGERPSLCVCGHGYSATRELSDCLHTVSRVSPPSRRIDLRRALSA